MKKVLIVSATKTGKTKLIGEYIANGLQSEGIDSKLVNAKSIILKKINLEDYDAFIFGSSTVAGSMLPIMKEVLIIAEKADLEKKIGGAFGTFGCCGKGPARIYETMKKQLNMNMVNSPLISDSETPAEMIGSGKDYGRKVAMKLAT